MQRRVKLSRFSLAFEIDFFVSQKVQPHTYLKAWGNFITSLRPQRVAVVELDSGDASQAHDDAQPVRHPEVPDGFVHVLDQSRHAHYNQLNFVKRWIFLNQYHLNFIVEYARTGDGSDFWHVQDESGFSDPYCSQTIGHRGY